MSTTSLLELAYTLSGAIFLEVRCAPAFLKALKRDYPKILKQMYSLSINVKVSPIYRNSTEVSLQWWDKKWREACDAVEYARTRIIWGRWLSGLF